MNEGRGEGKVTPPPDQPRPQPPATVLSEPGQGRPRASSSLEQLPLPAGGTAFLSSLVRLQLLTPDAIREFLDQTAVPLGEFTDAEVIGNDLIQNKLLTPYQLSRVMSGRTHGLVFGN